MRHPNWDNMDWQEKYHELAKEYSCLAEENAILVEENYLFKKEKIMSEGCSSSNCCKSNDVKCKLVGTMEILVNTANVLLLDLGGDIPETSRADLAKLNKELKSAVDSICDKVCVEGDCCSSASECCQGG